MSLESGSKFEKGVLFGSFDIWHAGDALMVKSAKKKCKHLTVGLEVSSIRKNLVNSLQERYLVLDSVADIDEIIVYDSEIELINILRVVTPDIRFLGDDYRPPDCGEVDGFSPYTSYEWGEYMNNTIVGYSWCRDICFIDREHGYSTTGVKDKIVSKHMETFIDARGYVNDTTRETV